MCKTYTQFLHAFVSCHQSTNLVPTKDGDVLYSEGLRVVEKDFDSSAANCTWT